MKTQPRSRRHTVAALAFALATGALGLPAWAQKAATALTPAEREAKGRNYFTDTALVAQDGRSLRFYGDVLKDHVVLINFVFTECGDACPLITHKLLQARQALGARAREVRFVSISIDPERDTPQTMLQFARKHNAIDPEWLWLTGPKANVDLVTRKLGAYTDDRNDHFTGLIVGNLRTDRWIKIRPDAPPAVITAQLRMVGEFDPKVGAAPAAAASAGKAP
jgi:cytochrome oxidase Cu insertion factor (SCO1/SenC/PrrC family)